jgi:serine protease Do
LEAIMIHRVSISIFVVCLMFGGALAQGDPAAENRERAERMLMWSLDGAGGYLGVQTKEVSRKNFAEFGLSGVRGVAIERVVEGSPAEKAGLMAGDVILRFNGEDVTSGRKLTRLVGEVSPDHTVNLIVARSGQEREIQVTLGKRQVPRFETGSLSIELPRGGEPMRIPFPMPDLERAQRVPLPRGEGGDVLVWRSAGSRQIGIVVSPLTKQLAAHFGVEGGVMITEVRENSPAAKAGLRAGDLIVEVAGQKVEGEMDVIRAIREKREGDVTLTIVRGGARQMVAVTPEDASINIEQFFRQNAPSVPPAPPAAPAAPGPVQPFIWPGRVI